MSLRFLMIFLCLSTTSWAAELLEKRAPAQKFKLDTIQGERYKLTDDTGKVVVVSFWATWCKPCLQELGFLKKLAQKHPDRLTVLAVSTDDANTISNVRKVAKRKRLTMPVLLDQDGSVMGLFNPRASLPFSAYIDHAGRIAATHSGFSSGDEDGIEKIVLALLDEQSKSKSNASETVTPPSKAVGKPQPTSATADLPQFQEKGTPAPIQNANPQKPTDAPPGADGE